MPIWKDNRLNTSEKEKAQATREDIRPENYDEIEAVLEILFDPDPSTEHLTRQRVRYLCRKKIMEMRNGESAEEVRGRG